MRLSRAGRSYLANCNENILPKYIQFLNTPLISIFTQAGTYQVRVRKLPRSINPVRFLSLPHSLIPADTPPLPFSCQPLSLLQFTERPVGYGDLLWRSPHNGARPVSYSFKRRRIIPLSLL